MRRPRGFGCVPATLVLAALAALGFGCGREEACCPTTCDARIEGFVLGGGLPVAATVRAFSPSGVEPVVTVEAYTDSSGWFALPLPSGGYLLQIRDDAFFDPMYVSTEGVLTPSDRADTIRVETQPVRIDVRAGRLRVNLRVPRELERDEMVCEVQNVFDHSISAAQPGRGVVEGAAPFEFPLLPEGSYRVRIRTGTQNLWLPRGDWDSADRIRVTAIGVTDCAAHLDAPAHIRGEVRGSWQAMGLRPPRIWAHLGDPHEPAAAADAGPGGEFDIALFLACRARIRIDFRWTDRWLGGDDFAGATVFEVDSAAVISGVSFVESGILCRLEGLAPGAPPDCNLRLLDEAGATVLERRSYDDNPIPIPNLETGTYRLRISPLHASQTWVAQWYDRQDSPERATPIVIATEGEVVPITVLLEEGGRITGRVLRADGTPYVYDRLRVCDAADPQREMAPNVVRDGEDPAAFSVLQLRTGDYRIGAVLEPDRVCWYPGTELWDQAGVIHVVQGSETAGIEWRLSR
jgi:hypothetical protein